MQEIEVPGIDLDSGSTSPEKCAQIVREWIDRGCEPMHPDEVIDWLDEMASEQ